MCLEYFRHGYLFRYLSSFGAVGLSEKVSEVGCLNEHASPNAHWPFVVQRMQSPLSELCLAFALPFPFAFPLLEAPLAGLFEFLALK